MSEMPNRLEFLFNPSSVAFVGASQNPGKWGFIILANILNGGYRGKVYPVNPREKKILGVEVCPSIASIPETPDLAVIVVPPPSGPREMSEGAQKGLKA